jgi:hypothetical protein
MWWQSIRPKIWKYGKDGFSPSSESAKLSNFYCLCPDLLRAIVLFKQSSVFRYSKGSLMPILTKAYIFSLVPKQTPFFIRPIANMIFGQLRTTLIEPRAKEDGHGNSLWITNINWLGYLDLGTLGETTFWMVRWWRPPNIGWLHDVVRTWCNCYPGVPTLALDPIQRNM